MYNESPEKGGRKFIGFAKFYYVLQLNEILRRKYKSTIPLRRMECAHRMLQGGASIKGSGG